MTPEGWREATLGEATNVIGGGTPKRQVPDYWDGDISWATPSDITALGGRSIFETKSSITAKGLAESSAKLLPAGTILMTSRATIGACAVAETAMATNQGFQNLVPGDTLTTAFLLYLVQSLRSELTRRAAGSTFLEISNKGVKAVPVALPPLPEQRKIAAILSSVDEVIEKTEAVIGQLQVLKKAMMRELLTRGLPGHHIRFKQTEIGEIPEDWEVVALGELADFINGRGFKPHEWSTEGLPIIRIQNLNGGEEYNHYGGEYNPKIEVHAGDLLFAWSGSRGTSFGPHIWMGSMGVLNYHTWKVACQSDAVSRDYLYFALRRITGEVERDAHGASALVHMQKRFIVDYQVALPGQAEQEGIAARLNLIESRLVAELKAKESLESAKAVLMSVLLTGEVRVHPDRETA
jgi:type I restriction enzyme, S subunit